MPPHESETVRPAEAGSESIELFRSQAMNGLTAALENSSRRHFVGQLQTALAKTSQRPTVAVLSIGFERFHYINDAFGYATGDLLLQIASRRLVVETQSSFLARTSDDELALVLENQPDEQSVLRMASGIVAALRAPYHIDGDDLAVTISVGVAMFPQQGNDAEELLRHACLAMHDARVSANQSVEVFQASSRTRALERLQLESALRRAIQNRELELLYQPVVSMQGEADAFEALLTWRHPQRGAVPPSEFIPITEETGLIVEIGSWVIEQACLAGAAWQRAGCREARISTNVSARQFDHSDFVDVVSSALAISGFPPRCLQLELTESCVMRDIAGSAQLMSRIRELGVSIAIDDFGTGYSSLSYLHKLPVDALKIDQSFLREIAEVDGSLPAIQSIVRLAHGRHLTVVAEGVETAEELELIRLVGCDKAQGHLYGPALRPPDVEQLLAPKFRAGAV